MDGTQNTRLSKLIHAQFRHYPYFFIIGALAYGLNIGLTFFFTEYIHLWYLLSFVISALVSLTCSFILNSLFTFRGYLRESHSKRYTLYIGFYIISAFITFTLVYVLTSILDIHYIISITAVTLASSFITYIVNISFIFQHS